MKNWKSVHNPEQYFQNSLHMEMQMKTIFAMEIEKWDQEPFLLLPNNCDNCKSMKNLMHSSLSELK